MSVFTVQFKHHNDSMIEKVLFCCGTRIDQLCMNDLFHLDVAVTKKLQSETSLDTVSAHVMCSKGNAVKLHSCHTVVQSRLYFLLFTPSTLLDIHIHVFT